MKIKGLFEGLPVKNRNLFLFSMVYTATTVLVAYRYHACEKNQEEQEHISTYRSSGHYKHPWVQNPTAVPVHVKKTDYTKLVEFPSGTIVYG